MKSIKESILSSTKTGKDALIKQWCDKYLQYWSPINGDAPKYSITKGGKITSPSGGEDIIISSELKEKVPSYIKFDEIKGNFYIQTELGFFKQEQLPPYMERLFISNCKTIPSLKLKLDTHLSVNDLIEKPGYNKLETIEPIEIEFTKKSKFEKPNIHLENTNIDLKSLLNIKTNYLYVLYIQNTPAAKEILKNIKKYKDSPDKQNEYLKDVFKNFPGIYKIFLSPRIYITHRENTDNFVVW